MYNKKKGKKGLKNNFFYLKNEFHQGLIKNNSPIGCKKTKTFIVKKIK